MPLVTSKEMFEKAYKGGYAIGAFNVNNMEIIQGITGAASKLSAPVILQVSKGARAYANRTYLMKLVEAAVIDTGLDTNHQSFDPDALTYGVEQASKESSVNYASQLLTTGKIETVLDQLNAYQRNAEAENTVTADQLYVNAKAPFGYNYIDGNFDVTHDNDSNGSHGSHVSGIAAANRYLKTEDGYVDALEAVNVAGNAPDAAQVAEYAIPAFQWAVGAGIINGTTATTLSPKGSATRGQVAAILHRYCEWIG